MGFDISPAEIPDDTKIDTWGDGGSRQLGQTGGGSFSKPTKVERLTNVEDVRCGRDFTVVLTKDHQLYSFGCNDDRQLGVVGTDRYQGTAIPIKTLKTKGIVQIAAGEKHAAALGADGSMYMWGHNKDGQLGNDSNMDSGKPVLVEQFRDAGLKVQSIACGSGHTSAITTDGALWVWGRGRAGQLGRGDQVESMAFYRRTPVRVDALNTHTVVGVALGGDHTLVIAYKK